LSELPDKVFEGIDMRRTSEPVFIFGCHKSGTSLLRSLLDHHQELSVERQNLDKGAYSDNPDFEGYDLDLFRDCFKEPLPEEHREIFRVYMEALYYASNGICIPEGSRVVEKTVEHLEYAGLIRKYFPESAIIHIVRNPYATMVAIRRSRSRERYPKLRRIASSIYNSSYFLMKNLLEHDNYLVLRYEDLVIDTENVMREISGFLGIEYQDILIRPTSSGKPWTGNTTSGKKFEGISRAPLETWKEHINGFEIELVNNISGPVMECFGYERLEPQRSAYWPVKGETPVTYFQNRMLLAMWKP